MNSEAELLQKLMISKKIMDKHNQIGRGEVRNTTMNSESFSAPMVEEFQAPPASYNIPQEFMLEQSKPTPQVNSNLPFEQKISNSKLPDDIKRLMMEHPIQQPTMGMSSGAVLSDELVEKASRLMNSTPSKNGVNESKNIAQTNRQQPTSQSINMEEIKDVIRETVQEVLYENGLLVESTKNSSDVFKFRVGQHIFEGKVTKIRKISK